MLNGGLVYGIATSKPEPLKSLISSHNQGINQNKSFQSRKKAPGSFGALGLALVHPGTRNHDMHI